MQSWGSSLGEESTPKAFPRVGFARDRTGNPQGRAACFLPLPRSAAFRAEQESAAPFSFALLRPLANARGAVPLPALAGDPREGRDGRGPTGSRSPP